MKNIFLFILIFTYACLGAVHNFTINNQEQATITIGDTLNIYFEFEEDGATASLNLELGAVGIDLPELPIPNMEIVDGSFPDETGVDGIFQYSIRDFISLPEIVTITISLEDNGVSDQVELNFEQLNSDFSIAGSVTRQGMFDMPVFPAMVYTFYNSIPEDITSIIENPSLDSLLTYFEEDHFIIAETNGFLGDYQLFIPDEIENVPCVTGVLSLLTGSIEYVDPGFNFSDVNGHLGNVDFHYASPDAYINGIITNSNNELIENAIVTLSDADDLTETSFAVSDSVGEFNFAVMNGDYVLSIAALGYDVYQEDITVNNSDINLEIELIDFVSNEENIAVQTSELKIYPNPFNRSGLARSDVMISFNSEASKNAKLEIFNVKGQIVTSRNISNIKQGENNITWNLNSDSSKKVTTGIYFIKLRTGKVTKTGKMLILK
jgi:hypothetical protein